MDSDLQNRWSEEEKMMRLFSNAIAECIYTLLIGSNHSTGRAVLY
jgi:hypothetical protein